MKRKKKAVRVIFCYLLLTTGLWMFLLSYSNSINRMSAEKISPASLNLNAERAEVKILEQSFSIDVSAFMPDSKLYYVFYMLTPDELRLASELSYCLTRLKRIL